MPTDTTPKIRDFVLKSIVFRTVEDGIDDRESLIESGLIDSTSILELVSFLEAEFKIDIDDQDIVPENLESISAIADYVDRKRSKASSTPTAA